MALMSDPFRGGSDPKSAHEFSQHLGVAEDQLAQVEEMLKRIDALNSGTGAPQIAMDELALAYSKGWEALWEQLQSARELCRKSGRDLRAYDAARTAAADIYVDVAKVTARHLGDRVQIKWQSRSTLPAHAAIAALRAAMPEVVVVKQAPIDVDLRPSSHKVVEVIKVLLGFAVLVAIAYVIYRAVK